MHHTLTTERLRWCHNGSSPHESGRRTRAAAAAATARHNRNRGHDCQQRYNNCSCPVHISMETAIRSGLAGGIHDIGDEEARELSTGEWSEVIADRVRTRITKKWLKTQKQNLGVSIHFSGVLFKEPVGSIYLFWTFPHTSRS